MKQKSFKKPFWLAVVWLALSLLFAWIWLKEEFSFWPLLWALWLLQLLWQVRFSQKSGMPLRMWSRHSFEQELERLVMLYAGICVQNAWILWTFIRLDLHACLSWLGTVSCLVLLAAFVLLSWQTMDD